MKKVNPQYTELLLLTCFVGVVALLLCGNLDVLEYARSRSLFLTTSLFATDCLQEVGGALCWIGLAGMQLFHYPVMGVTMLLLLWLVAYLLLRKTFPLTPPLRWLYLLPIGALVISITGVGYWIYYLKMPGYWVRESVGVIITLLLLLCDKDKRHLFAPLLAACIYPLIGWYTSLTLLLLGIRNLLNRRWISTVLATVLLLVVPAVIGNLYPSLLKQEVWLANYPGVSYNEASSSMISGAFILLPLSLILLCLFSHLKLNLMRSGLLVSAAGTALIAGMIFACNVTDYNFHAELRMYRDLQEQRWGDILTEMKDTPDGPTRQMICCKNIALLHKGTIVASMFAFDNEGPMPAVADSLEIHLAQTISPSLFLYHGMANDATRWAIENSVEYGYCIDYLHILTQAALISEEIPLARKYIEILKSVPFEEDFVNRYEPLCNNPETIGSFADLQVMKELHNELGSQIMKDNGDVEAYIYKFWANKLNYKSRRAANLAITYALTTKKFLFIAPHLSNYLDQQGTDALPQPIKEALYLGQHLKEKQEKLMGYSVDEATNKRFETLMRTNAPKNDYSYGWYYLHAKNANTY